MLKKNILIVDDDPLVIISVFHFFCAKGYEVVATNSPEAVISSINPDNFDVIITDFRMGPINGIELIKRIRDRGFSGKIILISAFSKLNETEGEETGIDAFFEKPFEIEDIHKKIKEWIG